MIKLEKNKTMQNAIERAKQFRPKVTFISERTFSVLSAKNSNSYTVKFDVVNGEKFASCDCKAGKDGRFICYHVAAAAQVNIIRQSVKRQAAKASAAANTNDAPYMLSAPVYSPAIQQVGRMRI